MNARKDEDWREDGRVRNWVMPVASRWRKRSGIRHVRSIWWGIRSLVSHVTHRRSYMVWRDYDKWVQYGVARGFERDPEINDDWPENRNV